MDAGADESLPHGGVTITGSMPDAFVGDPVDFTYTITGSYPGQQVTLTVTGLPTGLTITDAGHVTGTLTEAGTFAIAIAAVDDCGNEASHDDSVVITGFTFASPRTVEWGSLPSVNNYGKMTATNADALALSNNADCMTLVYLFDTALLQSTPALFFSTDADAGNYRASLALDASANVHAIGRTLDADIDTDATSPLTYADQWVMALAEFDYAGGEVRLHINGAVVETAALATTANTAAADSLSVGMNAGSSQRVRGGELMVYRGQLTQAQIDKLFGYLAENWDQRDSLPADHPYKTASVGGWTPHDADIWCYADNPDNTLRDASHISTLADASGNGNDMANNTGLAENDLALTALATPL
jgi:hypothetical protein